ncbi:MAG: hypothetical protein M3356_07110 [Actinomycetota bacterium]|nr:hypothetical protein [Actinomycetota bacterium]
MGPRRALLLLGWIAALALPACAKEERSGVPPACRQGPVAVRDALRAAPGEVRLDGTPLSACLADESDAAELADVGTAFVNVAAELAAAAARRPDGDEATQLGYLMGATQRGVREHQGVNAELVRRLEQEALIVGRRSEAFSRGERAGLRGG